MKDGGAFSRGRRHLLCAHDYFSSRARRAYNYALFIRGMGAQLRRHKICFHAAAAAPPRARAWARTSLRTPDAASSELPFFISWHFPDKDSRCYAEVSFLPT